jgi:serine/threonine protein kinase/formylglycine-generating enzyme required for sulfatase activity
MSIIVLVPSIRLRGTVDNSSLSQRKVIDRLADQFEREFKVGEHPRIEDYLEQYPALRRQILAELLALEVELRRTTGDKPNADEYRKRFQNDGELVGAAFGASDIAGSTIVHAVDTSLDDEGPMPQAIGRYEIRRILGRGGFGVVYLAHDAQLDRLVALKVPRRKRFKTSERVARFIEEARAAAKLKHASLVVVFDVQEHDGMPYIVQEYIEGQHLGDWSAAKRPSFDEIGRVLVGVSEALGYAHQHGLTHCDLKLANVLMDTSGQPHVADFGLAVHESVQAFRKGEVFGTPAIMAPEQVRGESHRLDGRTDIWAIGVMLYELLVDRKPFTAESRKELYAEIQNHDPKPPRQIDRQVPWELERICLKCLSKRRTDRYNTTDDLREDLLAWLEVVKEIPTSTKSEHPVSVVTPSDFSTKPPIKIIPKGLRSFDAEDADFFLELLPGPRDRDGLPDSIRFWKNRIEETDPDKTFSVGLIYGPSGCGKSSLVKAGLLPRLGDHVLPIYVEATADDTEIGILKSIRKHFPQLPDGSSLVEVFAELRDIGAPHNRKVFVLIDQFEQWLHTHRSHEATDLVDALRQCDGEHVQCIVILRDDFWMAATRFMRELEAPVVEGHNSAAVDLFSRRHARYVIEEFGRALGSLPASGDLSPDEKRYIAKAVDDLAQNDKVNCVRLALLAEMTREAPWSTSELKRVGGLEGLGIAFLEEKFTYAMASPRFRVHQDAAAAVLESLLPEPGDEIRGGVKSYSSLLSASGYHDHQKFDELLAILDGETRLITPCDPDATGGRAQQHYQLTHDYLVSSIRQWMKKKKRETREGRALLQLADRASFWNVQRETRQLPSVVEWMSIWLWTKPSQWTASQQQMMRSANRHHGLRVMLSASVIGLMLAVGFGVRNWARRAEARYQRESLVERIEGTNMVEAIELTRNEVPPGNSELHDLLRQRLGKVPPESVNAMQLRLALLPSDHDQLEYLKQDALRIPFPALLPVRDALAGYSAELTPVLWEVVRDEKESQDRRIRAAGLLAEYDPPKAHGARWKSVAPQLASDILDLVLQNPSNFTSLRVAFQNVGPYLYDDLRLAYNDPNLAERRYWATAVLSAYTREDLPFRAELILDANEVQFRELVGEFETARDPALNVFRRLLATRPESLGSPTDVSAKARLASRQTNAALVLLRTGHGDEAWKRFARAPDPSVRSLLIERISWGIGTKALIERVLQETDPGTLSGLLMALGRSAQHDPDLSDEQRQRLFKTLNARFVEDTDPGVHSATEWAMLRWGISPPSSLPRLNPRNDWYTDQFGHTFSIIRSPVSFQMGSPEDQPDRNENEPYEPKTIDYTFAIATKEETVAQYEQFKAEQPELARIHFPEYSAAPQKPQTALTWHQAALYCNWLSVRAGLGPDQLCYENDRMEKGMQLMRPAANATRRVGYRLPTEVEWEYACRAGTTTSRYYGNSLELLHRYAFRNVEGDATESGAQDVGRLLPNDLGLYDVLGNAREWCHDNIDGDETAILRGGSLYFLRATIRSANRSVLDPNISLFDVGIRVVRTIPRAD